LIASIQNPLYELVQNERRFLLDLLTIQQLAIASQDPHKCLECNPELVDKSMDSVGAVFLGARCRSAKSFPKSFLKQFSTVSDAVLSVVVKMLTWSRDVQYVFERMANCETVLQLGEEITPLQRLFSLEAANMFHGYAMLFDHSLKDIRNDLELGAVNCLAMRGLGNHNMGLGALLLTPIQRSMRYAMTLQSLVGNIKKHMVRNDYWELLLMSAEASLTAVTKFADVTNKGPELFSRDVVEVQRELDAMRVTERHYHRHKPTKDSISLGLWGEVIDELKLALPSQPLLSPIDDTVHITRQTLNKYTPLPKIRS